ncbi:MAG: hypothetical protein RL607_1325 [Bacteroidota bacterium]|jgi:hypothetical protein
MRKAVYILFLALITLSCKDEKTRLTEDLIKKNNDFDKLRILIEKEFEFEFVSRKNNNLLVFTYPSKKNIEYNSTRVEHIDILIPYMEELNISEIIFEKYSPSCDLNFGFNQVSFRIKNGSENSTVYYRYEYCGTSKQYLSKTIYYNPINSNWSVFVEY